MAQVPPPHVPHNMAPSVKPLPPRPGERHSIEPIDVLQIDQASSVSRLAGVIVQGQVLETDIREYWRHALGQPVDATSIQTFNGWLFSEARRQGHLSYAQTRVVRDGDGEKIEVTVLQPRIHAVRVVAENSDLMTLYGALVLHRLAQDFKTEQTIDTLGLDQRLDSASYDLPLELAATLRAVGPEQVDLIVNMNASQTEAGQRLNSLFQLNNHGLKTYGRGQLLGSFSGRGHEPKSSWGVLLQKSEGLTYGRSEYETAMYGSMHRLRAWGSHSDSRSLLGGTAATQGQTVEWGLGVTGIFDAHRDFVFKQNVDAVVRHSASSLQASGLSTSRVHDQQVRFRTVVDNEKLTADASRLEYLFTVGHYRLLEGISSVDSGPYAKLELGLKHQSVWDTARSVHSLVRFRGQLSSGRLDAYNQFAIGGVSGVRAYTTAEGVGDRGAVLSLELHQRLPNGVTVGAFYDAGVVKLLSPQPMEPAHSYTLQAAGLQLNMGDQSVQYTLNIAKGLGGYKGWTGTIHNVESRPDNWRVSLALTYFL